MPTLARAGALTTLHNAVNTAVNGTALSVADAEGVLLEVSGTFTNINLFFEGSLDGGTTYSAVTMRNSAGTLVSSVSPAVVGLYRLEDSRGLTHVRARTTIGAATGALTVRAVAIRN